MLPAAIITSALPPNHISTTVNSFSLTFSSVSKSLCNASHRITKTFASTSDDVASGVSDACYALTDGVGGGACDIAYDGVRRIDEFFGSRGCTETARCGAEEAYSPVSGMLEYIIKSREATYPSVAAAGWSGLTCWRS